MDGEDQIPEFRGRLSTLETQFGTFTEQYAQDRKHDVDERARIQRHSDDQFSAVFRKLDQVGSMVTKQEASSGRIPVALVISVVIGLPAIVVPIVMLQNSFIGKAIEPIVQVQKETREDVERAREDLIQARINIARMDERHATEDRLSQTTHTP